jgi:VanZ family protein
MGIIFLFSTDTFSGSQTSRIIGPILKWFVPDISDDTLVWFQLVIRKTAHVVEYAILTTLICRSLAKALTLRSLGQAVMLSIAYAAFDEWHQSWTAERFGSLLDVGIDSVGAILGATFFAWLSRRESRS